MRLDTIRPLRFIVVFGSCERRHRRCRAGPLKLSASPGADKAELVSRKDLRIRGCRHSSDVGSSPWNARLIVHRKVTREISCSCMRLQVARADLHLRAVRQDRRSRSKARSACRRACSSYSRAHSCTFRFSCAFDAKPCGISNSSLGLEAALSCWDRGRGSCRRRQVRPAGRSRIRKRRRRESTLP